MPVAGKIGEIVIGCLKVQHGKADFAHETTIVQLVHSVQSSVAFVRIDAATINSFLLLGMDILLPVNGLRLARTCFQDCANGKLLHRLAKKLVIHVQLEIIK
jgi:hypothetical protein